MTLLITTFSKVFLDVWLLKGILRNKVLNEKILNWVRQNSQFVIATHSPILIAYPNAIIYEISNQGIQIKKYGETELFKVYKDFFTNTDELIEFLLYGEE